MGRGNEPGEYPKQRCLSATARADDGQKFTARSRGSHHQHLIMFLASVFEPLVQCAPAPWRRPWSLHSRFQMAARFTSSFSRCSGLVAGVGPRQGAMRRSITLTPSERHACGGQDQYRDEQAPHVEGLTGDRDQKAEAGLGTESSATTTPFDHAPPDTQAQSRDDVRDGARYQHFREDCDRWRRRRARSPSGARRRFRCPFGC